MTRKHKKHYVKKEVIGKEQIKFGYNIYTMGGKRAGQIVEICFSPRMEGTVIGCNESGSLWLIEHTYPPQSKGNYTTMTENFLTYVVDGKEIE